MVHQRFIDLARRDFLAAAIDDLLQPPGEREIAVGVDDALIAGAEPAIDERLRIGLRIVLVSSGDVVAANDDSPASPRPGGRPASAMPRSQDPRDAGRSGLRTPLRGG
jgi:hypothetical protein